MKNLNRREFLKSSGKVIGGLAGSGILGSLPIINSRCKGGPGGSRTPVTVNVTFYNHMLGQLGQRTYDGLSGESLIIRTSDLGFTGIDQERMGTRKASGSRETMGEFIRATRNGVASLQFPQQNEDWEIYHLDAGADYESVQTGPHLQYPVKLTNRYLKWCREDQEATGPEELILEAFRQSNEALDHPWKRYGSFIQQDDAVMRVGYSSIISVKPVMLRGDYIFIDPASCESNEEILKLFIKSIFSITTSKYTYGGSPSLEFIGPTGLPICNEQTGDLNDTGAKLLASAYVMN